MSPALPSWPRPQASDTSVSRGQPVAEPWSEGRGDPLGTGRGRGTSSHSSLSCPLSVASCRHRHNDHDPKPRPWPHALHAQSGHFWTHHAWVKTQHQSLSAQDAPPPVRQTQPAGGHTEAGRQPGCQPGWRHWGPQTRRPGVGTPSLGGMRGAESPSSPSRLPTP